MRKGQVAVYVTALLVCTALSDCVDQSEKTCPTFTCDKSRLPNSNTCAMCDLLVSKCYLQECPDSSLTCPPPAEWFSGSPVTCESWDSMKWSASSFEEYYGVSSLPANSTCVLNEPTSRCSFSDDLVCSCTESSCSCAAGVGYGGVCDSSTVCLQGYICNSGTCMKLNSLEAGIAVTDFEACVSGKVYMEEGVKRCTNPPRTLGIIPKQCASCIDCTSVDGTATSDCVCGLDGKSYCTLLEGDDPWLEYRNLAPNQRYDGIVYWDFVIHNYPYIQDVPDCVEDVWRDYGKSRSGPPNYSGAAGLAAVLVGLMT